MSKVFLSWIMRPILILNWYLGVPLCFLITSDLQIFWLQSLTRKVRNIVLIIICTLEVFKGDQF